MRKILVMVFLLTFSTSLVFAKKLYEVESGIVKIDKKDLKNSSEDETIHMYFEDYGQHLAMETYDKNMVLKTKVIFDNNIMHSIDYAKKSIVKMDFDKMKFFSNMIDIEYVKKEFNLKKSGTDKVLGYKCENFKNDQMQMCIYKGISLKSHASFLGYETSTIATSIKFNTSINANVFKMPNFKVTSSDDLLKSLKDEDDEDMQESLNDLQKSIKKLSPEERKNLENLMKNLTK